MVHPLQIFLCRGIGLELDGADAPTRLLSLTVGNVDATILSPPHLTMAVKAGYRILGDMGEMRASFSQSTLYVRRSYLKENRDIVKRFVAKAVYDDLAQGIGAQEAVDRALRAFPPEIHLGVIAIAADSEGGGSNYSAERKSFDRNYARNMPWTVRTGR